MSESPAPTPGPHGTDSLIRPRPVLPPAPTSPTPPRKRGRVAAGVIAASLAAGSLAGVGGAAAWTTYADRPGPTSVAAAPVPEPAPAPAPDGSIEAVAARVLPSVVRLDVSGPTGAGSGSGVVLDEEGTILTNHHVVEAATTGGSIRVSFTDGTSAPATVLGTDPLTDTAVVRAEGVTGRSPAEIGRSTGLSVGQQVVAFGAPFGLDATVTSGIVSALDRPVAVGADGQGNSAAYPAIQTDAAINPGNSGGPLVDLAGRVVGINSSIRSPGASTGSAGSVGLGFAIPIDEVMPLVPAMEAGRTPEHARLGVSVGDAADDTGLTLGARVGEVQPGSAAAEAGLRTDDVITRLDGHGIDGADGLVAIVRSYRPGDRVRVEYLRDGRAATTELTLGSDAPTT